MFTSAGKPEEGCPSARVTQEFGCACEIAFLSQNPRRASDTRKTPLGGVFRVFIAAEFETSCALTEISTESGCRACPRKKTHSSKTDASFLAMFLLPVIFPPVTRRRAARRKHKR